jgi:hypothetical protein
MATIKLKIHLDDKRNPMRWKNGWVAKCVGTIICDPKNVPLRARKPHDLITVSLLKN